MLSCLGLNDCDGYYVTNERHLRDDCCRLAT